VGGGLPGGKLAGIAVGASLGTLLLVGIAVTVYLLGKRHERRKAAASRPQYQPGVSSTAYGNTTPQSPQHQQFVMPELMAPQHQ
jgi:hypothetical protein